MGPHHLQSNGILLKLHSFLMPMLETTSMTNEIGKIPYNFHLLALGCLKAFILKTTHSSFLSVETL